MKKNSFDFLFHPRLGKRSRNDEINGWHSTIEMFAEG